MKKDKKLQSMDKKADKKPDKLSNNKKLSDKTSTIDRKGSLFKNSGKSELDSIDPIKDQQEMNDDLQRLNSNPALAFNLKIR